LSAPRDPSALDAAEILRLHREITAIPSVSGAEADVAGRLEGWLADRGITPRRVGGSLLALKGAGPVLLLDSHLDTVPASPGWSRDPHAVAVVEGKVFGLGSNDAKASVAAMAAAFAAFDPAGASIALGLGLVAGEETDGHGTVAILRELDRLGRRPVAGVVGEPTGLDVAIAQKGLLILEIFAKGDACHAAHGRTLRARNAVRALARDLVALDSVDLGEEHPALGPTTLEPTVIRGGSARNAIPGEASVVLDLRTVPGLGHADLVRRVRASVASEVRIVSERLLPRETPADAAIVRAALRARPGANLYGSSTMSDLAFFEGIPAVKVGPGRSERSHTPDEFVLEEEILDGAKFYGDLVRAYETLTQARTEAQEAKAAKEAES